MADNLRSKMIRLAATLPVGSEERKALLNVLATARGLTFKDGYALKEGRTPYVLRVSDPNLAARPLREYRFLQFRMDDKRLYFDVEVVIYQQRDPLGHRPRPVTRKAEGSLTYSYAGNAEEFASKNTLANTLYLVASGDGVDNKFFDNRNTPRIEIYLSDGGSWKPAAKDQWG